MTFDLEAFKAAALHDVTPDQYTAKPTGDYGVQIMGAEIAGGGENSTGPWVRYELNLYFDDGDRKRISLFPRLNESGTALHSDPNKNIVLGELRTAIGKNTPGSKFQWSDPEGHHVIVTLGHRLDNNGKTQEQITHFRKG